MTDKVLGAAARAPAEIVVPPMFYGMDGPTLLRTVGDDAQKWAQAFMELIVRPKRDIDEGLMIGWFANAIEHSADTRRWRAEAAEREAWKCKEKPSLPLLLGRGKDAR